jgi:6-pyruvoyltetrahydropterin/6-carboxytetrahydropterin synthase
MTLTCSRYHDFSAGHRVYGHENKCGYLHGHNYRVSFTCETYSADGMDWLGRVIDFGIMKTALCEWLEKNWDHKMLLWESDPYVRAALEHDNSVVKVPFNPTAENMAKYLLEVVGPEMLKDTDVFLKRVDVSETRKCWASAELNDARLAGSRHAIAAE